MTKDRLTYLRETHGDALLMAFRADRRNAPCSAWLLDDTGAPMGETAAADAVFKRYRAADPTRNGACLQWLIRQALAGGLPAEDLDKAKETLSAFDAYKRRLPADQRDLNRYASLGDVWEAVEPFALVNAPTSKADEDRRERDAAHAESTILLEERGWTVAIPRTYAASKWWGRGTRWCTASSDQPGLFTVYNRRGPLIVFAGPAGRKYQFHAPSRAFMDAADRPADPTEALADLMPTLREHTPILQRTMASASSGWRHALVVCRLFLRNLADHMRLPTRVPSDAASYVDAVCEYGLPLKLVPHSALTKAVCRDWVEHSPNDLGMVPASIIDEDICLTAVSVDGMAITKVPKRLRTKRVVEAAIRQNIGALLSVRDTVTDPETWRMAISHDSHYLRHAPPEAMTRAACLAAVSQKGALLRHVPPTLRDREMCLAAVRNDGEALRFVPSSVADDMVRLAAVTSYPEVLRRLPSHLRDRDLCLEAVRKNGLMLEFVPDSLRDREICEVAIGADGEALAHVPLPLRTYALCRKAVGRSDRVGGRGRLGMGLGGEDEIWFDDRLIGNIGNTPSSLPLQSLLHHVPPEHRDAALCHLAVSIRHECMRDVPEALIGADQDRWQEECELIAEFYGALDVVPTRFRSRRTCWLALQFDPMALKHVPEDLKDEELCTFCVTANGESLQFVPWELRTHDLCLEAVRQYGGAFAFVPEGLRTQSFLEDLVKAAGWSHVVRTVPAAHMSVALAMTAAAQNGAAIRHLPPHLQGPVRRALWPSMVRTVWTQIVAVVRLAIY